MSWKCGNCKSMIYDDQDDCPWCMLDEARAEIGTQSSEGEIMREALEEIKNLNDPDGEYRADQACDIAHDTLNLDLTKRNLPAR